MIRRVPDYYRDFRCIASDCKDNCCVGGLCEMYQKLGEENMGVVCDQFPRFTEYYGTVKETGIGLACEEAARIILEKKDELKLIEDIIDEEEIEDSEYDSALAHALFRLRDIWIEQLNAVNTQKKLHQVLISMLLTADKIQELINADDFESIKDVCDKNFDIAAMNTGETDILECMKDIVSVYNDVEMLNEDWPNVIENISDNILSMEKDEYMSVVTEFIRSMENRSYEYRNLIEYLVFRYSMKAVYDYNLLGKVQLIIGHYLVILQQDVTIWITNNRNYSFEDRMNNIHIFSREIEYSEDNIEELTENFLYEEAFHVENLANILNSI